MFTLAAHALLPLTLLPSFWQLIHASPMDRPRDRGDWNTHPWGDQGFSEFLSANSWTGMGEAVDSSSHAGLTNYNYDMGNFASQQDHYGASQLHMPSAAHPSEYENVPWNHPVDASSHSFSHHHFQDASAPFSHHEAMSQQPQQQQHQYHQEESSIMPENAEEELDIGLDGGDDYGDDGASVENDAASIQRFGWPRNDWDEDRSVGKTRARKARKSYHEAFPHLSSARVYRILKARCNVALAHALISKYQSERKRAILYIHRMKIPLGKIKAEEMLGHNVWEIVSRIEAQTGYDMKRILQGFTLALDKSLAAKLLSEQSFHSGVEILEQAIHSQIRYEEQLEQQGRL